MRNTEQSLDTAIAALRCLNPDRAASLDELTALSAVRDCIDELLSSCVDELRSDRHAHHSWAAIAYAIGSSSQAAVRKKYGTLTATVDAESDDQIATFWRAFAARFVWDFLPVDFLHALYVQWTMQGAPQVLPLPQKAFSRDVSGPQRPHPGRGATRVPVPVRSWLPMSPCWRLRPTGRGSRPTPLSTVFAAPRRSDLRHAQAPATAASPRYPKGPHDQADSPTDSREQEPAVSRLRDVGLQPMWRSSCPREPILARRAALSTLPKPRRTDGADPSSRCPRSRSRGGLRGRSG